MKNWFLIFSVCLVSCATRPKINTSAPLSIPRPNASKSTEKFAEELTKIKITIDSADSRVDRIRELFDGFNSN